MEEKMIERKKRNRRKKGERQRQRERERERDRQTDIQADRQRQIATLVVNKTLLINENEVSNCSHLLVHRN